MDELEDCVRMAGVLFEETAYVAIWQNGEGNLSGEGFSASIEVDGESFTEAFVRPTAQEAVHALRENLVKRCEEIAVVARQVKVKSCG